MLTAIPERNLKDTVVRGACLCGVVRFAIAPPYRWFGHCHCSMCRKHHGSTFATGLGVARDRLEWLSGRGSIVHYRATAAFERPFCARCGSTVPGVSHAPDVLHVPAGLLESDPGARPRTHIFAGSKAAFDEIDDALPRFAAYPPGIDLPVVERSSVPARRDGLAGRCLCGTIEFELTAPVERVVHCHCSLCRRATGGAFATWLAVALGGFRFRHGSASVRALRLAEARYETRFCAECGSPMPIRVRGAAVRVPAGSLDAPLAVPAVHVHVAEKAPWLAITGRAPRFEKRPPDDALPELGG